MRRNHIILFLSSLVLESMSFNSGKFNRSIILVSSKYEILHVLRTFRPIVPPGADPAAFQVYEVGARYTSLEAQPRKYEVMTRNRLETMLRENISVEEPEDEETNALMPQGDATSAKKTFRKKKEFKNTIRKALLNGAAEYGAQLVEQVIRASRIDGNTLITHISDSIPSQYLVDIRSIYYRFSPRAIQPSG
jgi:hypothetical protein